MKFPNFNLAVIFFGVLIIKADNFNSLQNPETYSKKGALLQNDVQKEIIENSEETTIINTFARQVIGFISNHMIGIKAKMPNHTDEETLLLPVGNIVTIYNFRNGTLGNLSTIALAKKVVLEKNQTSYTIYMPVEFTDLEISYDYKVSIGRYILSGKATSRLPKTKATISTTAHADESFRNKIGNVLFEGKRRVRRDKMYSNMPNSKFWKLVKRLVFGYMYTHLVHVLPMLVTETLNLIVERTNEVQWAL